MNHFLVFLIITNNIYLFVDTVKKLLTINNKKMFNLEIITRLLNFVWKDYRNIKKEFLIQKKKKRRKERKKESTCSIKFYVMEAIYHNTLTRKKN